MPPSPIRRLAGAAAFALLAFGELPAAHAAEPSVEPRAAELVKAALTHLSRAGNIALRAEMTAETALPSGEKLQYPATLEVSLRRPDRLRYTIDGERRRIGGWYDGKTFTLRDGEKNVCAATPAPRSLSALFDGLKEKYGFRPPLAILLREDSADAALKGVTSGFHAGRGKVDGVLCEHLAFRQEKIDWQIWIAAEGDPVIKRIVMIRKQLPGAPQLSFTFLSWDFKTALEDARFVFEPPQGAVWCEFQKLSAQ
jgi:hypothetical protein